MSKSTTEGANFKIYHIKRGKTMYIHLGGTVTVPRDKIIGIFDIEKTSVNKDVNDYLKKLQKSGLITYASFEMPKSFVVTDNQVYITNVSVFTLKKRMNYEEIVLWGKK